MILGMGFPNLIGVFVMRKEIREALTTYQKVRRRFW
jgi:Na+/alanine symporter